MIVTVFEDKKGPKVKLLEQSDLAVKRTDEKTALSNQPLYRVTKSRYGDYQGKLLIADEIRELAQEYEARNRERKQSSPDRKKHSPPIDRDGPIAQGFSDDVG